MSVGEHQHSSSPLEPASVVPSPIDSVQAVPELSLAQTDQQHLLDATVPDVESQPISSEQYQETYTRGGNEYYERNSNDDYYFLDYPEPSSSAPSMFMLPASTMPEYEDPLMMVQHHDLVDMANRTFIATCHKFARQNYPEFRRRSPYSFLENWHLHSMYSKSQQVLLGIPHVQPIVLLAGDDFMFTPQLVQQQQYEHIEQMQFDWHDEDEDEDEDAAAMDVDAEDVLVVTARAPEPEDVAIQTPIIIDENTWMGHSRHHNQNHQHHHHQQQNLVEDEHEQSDQMAAPENTSLDKANEDEQEMTDGFTLSPEIVHLYRSAQYHQRRPSTIMESPIEDRALDNVIDKVEDTQIIKDMPQMTSVNSYQSLADMMTSAPAVPDDTLVIPMTTDLEEGYGTVTVCEEDDQSENEKSDEWPDENWLLQQFSMFAFSLYIAQSLVAAFEVADAKMYDDKRHNTIFRYVTCLFQVWRLLFTCAETVLSDVGGKVLTFQGKKPPTLDV